eukprot:192064-Amphidinium_carterae.2
MVGRWQVIEPYRWLALQLLPLARFTILVSGRCCKQPEGGKKNWPGEQAKNTMPQDNDVEHSLKKPIADAKDDPVLQMFSKTRWLPCSPRSALRSTRAALGASQAAFRRDGPEDQTGCKLLHEAGACARDALREELVTREACSPLQVIQAREHLGVRAGQALARVASYCRLVQPGWRNFGLCRRSEEALQRLAAYSYTDLSSGCSIHLSKVALSIYPWVAVSIYQLGLLCPSICLDLLKFFLRNRPWVALSIYVGSPYPPIGLLCPSMAQKGRIPAPCIPPLNVIS